MLFDCRPKVLHKHCLQFLLGVKMAPRETENNAYAKFWGDKQRTLWYVIVFLEWSILLVNFGKVLWSFANKLQQNSNTSSSKVYIPQVSTVLLQIPLHLHLTFAAFCLMSVIRKQRLE